MPYLLIGLAALLIGVYALPRIIGARGASIGQRLQAVAGCMALIAAAVTVARGSPLGGLLTAASAVWMLHGVRDILAPAGFAAPRPGRERIATEHLDVERTVATGAVRGRVVKGFFAGRRIQDLRPVELAHLWQDCRLVDAASAAVVEAYLDRQHPTWREDLARAEAELPRGPDGQMTRVEAFEILGLKDGAGDDAIRRAHRELMLRMHPDRGGSNYLAAKINEAKEVALGGR